MVSSLPLFHFPSQEENLRTLNSYIKPANALLFFIFEPKNLYFSTFKEFT